MACFTIRHSIRPCEGVPTVLRAEGFRFFFFFFFSNEGSEPPHVHVEGAGGYGKWWLDPLEMAYSRGFTVKELRRIRELLDERLGELES